MKKIMGASLGEDVHIQGIFNFLKLAEENGYQSNFLGPKIDIKTIISSIKEQNPDIVALSYRLTPETAENIIQRLDQRIKEEGLTDVKYFFGGTEPVAEIAKKYDMFSFVFNGNNQVELETLLKNSPTSDVNTIYPQNIVERVDWKKPYPVLRTHFGQPTLEATINGIKKISDSGLIDVISLGIDQDAQENFFHPERQDPRRAGAGGVPIRKAEDLEKLYETSRTGNFPLIRSYAGTDNLEEMAAMYLETINNAWSAIPIFWFNDMDGRGPHPLEDSIKQHLDLIKWHAEKDVPVEVLEAHHWGMRWAHDSLVVASAYLGAKITKELGVEDYIHQYMFNIPPETSFSNDLAKMLAIKEMINELEDGSFNVYHQTRAGLSSFPLNLESARAQLASSTLLQMQLEPDIIHVVNYSEPHHAATTQDIINSAQIVYQIIKNSLGMPNFTTNSDIITRKDELKGQALELIRYMEQNGDITDPEYLSSIVYNGVFDAPMLKNNKYALGNIEVTEQNGAYFPTQNGKIIDEKQRLGQLKKQ